ncbi:D-alanine--D-alanine ligase [Lewinellaceae bacterium SD302]|nr:D-alanine--D-alanine ligase [Lewinellaceae bacterium SD302]
MSISVGIFFGGPSREREISFAGGRTVYDNLNKRLFEAVPIFVDSYRNWYLLDWEYLYKGSIRDFFPPVSELPDSPNGFQVYQESLLPQSEMDFERLAKSVGRRIRKFELNEIIDVAFLALHGIYGEDGVLQSELDRLGLPYTGSGVEASRIGIDKALQKELMGKLDFATPPIEVVTREAYLNGDLNDLYALAVAKIGWPLVIRPANQGSSIGVSIISEDAGMEGFETAMNRAFFREVILLSEWAARSSFDRLEYVRFLSDIRDGLGYPLDATHGDHRLTIYHPEELLRYLDSKSQTDPGGLVILEAHENESRVILEGFIDGKEFSTIVLRTPDGGCVALPPTEIVKGSEVFDYRSKYLPGLSRKITPIDLPNDRIEAIRRETERLFTELGFATYARIDGFHTAAGEIFLNDPNTTSGMLPSSFFFHQAAEIGLNPSQFLTYILRASLQERLAEGNEFAGELMQQLDGAVKALRAAADDRIKVAVLLGGTSFERHISVESGRNVFEKLASSDKYTPIPVFLTGLADNSEGLATTTAAKVAVADGKAGSSSAYELHQLPINLLLKDNADDIREKVLQFKDHPVLAGIRRECKPITAIYADPNVVFSPQETNWDRLSKEVDEVFIALHGRPGEDGQVQMQLDARGIPYNGSGVKSSSRTINKYKTLQTLKEAGLPVADQLLMEKAGFLSDEEKFYETVEGRLGYPFIAKPVDDGCSSAVMLIRGRDELHAYCRLIFLVDDLDEAAARRELKLKAKEEFPVKTQVLFEELIEAKGAEKFLEITGGLVTHFGSPPPPVLGKEHCYIDSQNGDYYYELFEPSEALASGAILSLEEKFLAGEGQNLTPARLYTDRFSYDEIAPKVKADLCRAAQLMGVTGYCRIDAFVRIYADGRVETLVIEINSLPGITPATAIFHQAAIAGYQPYGFIDQLLTFGRRREERRSGTTPTLSPARDHTDVRQKTVIASTMTNEPTQYSETDLETEPAYQETEYVDQPDSKFTDDQPNWKRYLLATKDFVLNSYFWRNLGVLVLGLIVGFMLLRAFLPLYTNHGEGIELPDFVDISIDEAHKIADAKDLTIKVIEGPFDPFREPGLVVQQTPRAGSLVKSNRSIYLTTLSSEAPQVSLPPLVGNYDYEQYTRKLDALKIQYVVSDQVYDPKQEENTILHFFFEDEKITDEDLRRGVKVPQGAKLNFVVTVRQTGEVKVPNIVCRRYSEAVFIVSGTSLVIGEVEGYMANDVTRRDDAYIYKTEPAAGRMLDVSSPIKVFLAKDRPSDCN